MKREQPSPAVVAAIASARVIAEQEGPTSAVTALGDLETENFAVADWISLGRFFRDQELREPARTAGRRALVLAPRDRDAYNLAATPFLVDGVEHSVPLIAAHSNAWRRLGQGAVAIGLLTSVLFVVLNPLQPPRAGSDGQLILLPKASMESFLLIAMYFASAVYGLSWLAVDIMDRKGRWAWLVFYPVLFFLGVPWLSIVAYRWMQKRLSPIPRPDPV